MKKLIKRIMTLSIFSSVFFLTSCNNVKDGTAYKNREFFKQQDCNVEVYNTKLENCDALNQKVINSLDDRTMEHEYNVLIINDLFTSVTLEEDDYTSLLYDINNNNLCLIYLGYHEEYFGNRGFFGNDEYTKYNGVIGSMFGPNQYLSRSSGVLHEDDLDIYERNKDIIEFSILDSIIRDYIRVEMEY